MKRNPTREVHEQKKQGCDEIGHPEPKALLEFLQGEASKGDFLEESDQYGGVEKTVPGE